MDKTVIFPEFSSKKEYYAQARSRAGKITSNDELLYAASPGRDIALVKGFDLRIWYFEDFNKQTTHDNTGMHCVYVDLEYF